MALISLTQAMNHLRLTFTTGVSPADSRETDLTLKIAHAEAIVIGYCNSTAHWRAITATWIDEDTVPAVVQAAILLQLSELYRFRGDEVEGQGPAQTVGGLSPQVVNLLMRHRDPVVA